MSQRALIPLVIIAGSAAIGLGAWFGDSAAPAAATPVIRAAGDIAGAGVGDNQTAALLSGADHVLTLGDNAYPSGSLDQYNTRYHPSWGAHKSRTHPNPGNHEWKTAGAAGYEAYFGEPDTHWYTWTLPGWRLISLDSTCRSVAGGCKPGSPQYTFLQNTLSSNREPCVLAYYHHPRFSIGLYAPGIRSVQPLWKLLAQHGADVVLTGHDHNYQRWEPLDANGAPAANGIRQFVVGTGGVGVHPLTTNDPRVDRSGIGFGVLELALRSNGYSWRFLPVAGSPISDSGSDSSCN